MDMLVIADAGLPVPPGVMRIDLALKEGIPTFLETTEAVLEEMQVERAVIASEISGHSPEIEVALRDLMGEVPLKMVSHEEFKRATANARAIVRTGEFSPYANVILVAGVVF